MTTRPLTGDKCSNCSVFLCAQAPPSTAVENTAADSRTSNFKDARPKVVSFVVDLNGEYKTVNVAGALTEIFDLEWLFSDCSSDSNLRNNLVLCDACLFVFSKLCKYFYEFQLLRKFDSFLTESLKKCKDLLASFTMSRKDRTGGPPHHEFTMENHNFRVHENVPHVQIPNPTFINAFPHFLSAESYTTQPEQLRTTDGKGNYQTVIGIQACPPQNVGQNFEPTHRFGTFELHTPQPSAYPTTQPANVETQQNVGYGWDKTASTNESERPEYLENSISKCPDCNAEFSSTIALGLHRFRAHNYNRKYTCKTCKKGFANARNLKQHMLRHLNIRPFKCHCDSTFKTKPDLQAHQRLVHSVEDRQRIKERIKRTSTWRKASGKATSPGFVGHNVEQNGFKCVDCGESHPTASALGDHRIKSHQSAEVYKCHFCGENFGHARSLKVHMIRHSGTRPIPCEPPRPAPQRGRKNYARNNSNQVGNRMQVGSFGQPSTSSYHQQPQQQKFVGKPNPNPNLGVGPPAGNGNWNEPKGSKRYGNYIPKCYHCNIEFESPISLGLHRFRFHNTGRKNICEICSKGFANARNLKDHMFRHLNIRPFKCDSCDLSFKTKQDLNNHNLYLHSAESRERRQHMVERRNLLLTTGAVEQQQQQPPPPPQIQACDSPDSNTMSSNISNPDSQQSGKGGESLVFKCADCQEEFSSASNLGDHRAQIHQAADLFKCHVCAKSFVNGNGLKEHMKRHTDQRNFRCEMCGSGFKVKLDLKQHHYLVHTEDGRRRLHENYARSRAKKQQQQAQKEAADAAALLEVTWSDDDTSEINVEDQEASAQRV